MTGTTSSRLEGDERRRQLVRAGIELLGQHPYDRISIAQIADAAGVSKGLLYHYFPTKDDYVVAVLDEASRELDELLALDPALTPLEQLDKALSRFLEFVERHAPAHTAIFRTRGAGEGDAVRKALEEGRRKRIAFVIDSIAAWATAELGKPPESAALETAVQGWIFFVEGAVLRWLDDGGISRDQLRALLGRMLVAAVLSAHEVDPELELPLPRGWDSDSRVKLPR
jgi:AcrR family transcriptional regulator